VVGEVENMGVLTPIVASTTAGGWIELLIFIGAIVLNYWAMMRIITQAGYSSLWIVLPLAPMVLTITCYVLLWTDIHRIFFDQEFGFEGFSNASLFWHLDELSIVLNWVFFIIFAFSTWPMSGGHPRDRSMPEPSSPASATPSGPASRAPSGAVNAVAPRAMPSSGAGPGSAPAPAATAAAAPKRVGTQFCPWCGESLPGNRALFHDCGSKDRPETICKNCGTPFPAGSTQCVSCDAS
jgi:hypothetical protein